MNFKKHASLTIYSLLFFLTACGVREADHCKISKSITANYVNECATPQGLALIGYGGAMLDDIQSITLTFLSFDRLTVDEARVLYIGMMEDFLQRINTDDSIRPYLHNFPFEERNIELTIGFEDTKRKITSDGHVALMSIGKDHKIYFAAYDSDTQKFYDLHEESYNEALQLAKHTYLEKPIVFPLRMQEVLQALSTEPKQEPGDVFPPEMMKQIARMGYHTTKTSSPSL